MVILEKQHNYKFSIIKELKYWISTERSLKKENPEDHTHDYKISAYKKVLDQIMLISTINSWEDLKDVKGIGKSIKGKIEDVFEQINIKSNIKDCNNIEKVYGVGPATALKLMQEHNIYTIQHLRRENSKNPDLLNRVQQIGLKYYNDLLKQIPRKEMDAHNKFLNKIIHKIDKNLVLSLVGSYRRKEKYSSDIDLLVSVSTDTSEKDRQNILHNIVYILKKEDYIKEVLSLGSKKFMGIAKLPRYIYYRRIDILITDKREYPFALLYFTGSKQFNIEFRKNVKNYGVVLNEYGVYNNKSARMDLDINTEKDIFDYFNIPYIDPEYRN